MGRPLYVYSEGYYADIGAHVFPMEKYREVYSKLVNAHGLDEDWFLTPEPAPLLDLSLVHTRHYLEDLMGYRHTARTLPSELPISEEIVQGSMLTAGGTMAASQLALQSRIGVNVGGGFHHAFPDHAEGFCYINDVAVAARVLGRDKQVERIAIVDCDLHQGNGTAVIFGQDPSVFTFSIHQEDLYPLKQKSDLDIGLDDFIGDEEYLAALKRALERILADFRPQFVFYLAGADPYSEDQLGALDLSIEGLKARDRFVLSSCLSNQIPCAVVLAGGYAWRLEDTVQIHLNTCLEALQLSKSAC